MMIVREIRVSNFETNQSIGIDQWMCIEIDTLLIVEKDRTIDTNC